MSNETNYQTSEAAIQASKKAVDRSIRTLMTEMEHENTLIAETPVSRFQKVLKIYRGIKPLFKVLGGLPLIPATWRAAVVMFDQALEALSGCSGALIEPFKAGKDV